MAKQTVNLGVVPNGVGGDDVRTGFTKVNDNFTELYTPPTQVEAETGTSQVVKGWTAQRVRQAITAWFTGISGTIGRTILGRSTAAEVRGDLGLGTAATANLTTSNLDGTEGRVLKVGDGGWMGQGGGISTPYGYPSSINDVTNQTKTIRSNVLDNGVPAIAAGFHFSAGGTWGRLRVRHDSPHALIQGGDAFSGTGWTSQVVLSSNVQQTTGSSTFFPMSQAATTNLLATKANTSTQVIAGTGLTGGGDLSSNRTLNTSYGTTAGTSVQGNDSRVVNALQRGNNLSDTTDKTLARSNLGLGSAAQATLTTATTDGTVGRVLKVGDGGWMGQGDFQSTPYGYPSSISDASHQTKVIRSTVGDNGVASNSSGIHFSSYDTWGRLRVAYATPNAWIQGGHAGRGTGWTAELYHTGNTTKNPDGTLKASSPVINLYTDKHDLHSEGQFGATPTVTRKAKGVYEISGTLGLRSDGWYLDTPSDRNGNKYFNIEWTQNITPDATGGAVDEYRDDIVVTIETFERVWNKETGMFDNGDPIDINDSQDRFVQLRFNEIKVEHEELGDDLS